MPKKLAVQHFFFFFFKLRMHRAKSGTPKSETPKSGTPKPGTPEPGTPKSGAPKFEVRNSENPGRTTKTPELRNSETIVFVVSSS